MVTPRLVCLLFASIVSLSACGGDDNNVDPNNTNNVNNTNNLNNTNNANNVNNTDGVPTESDALFAWLQTSPYSGWTSESAIHASAGPHFGDVLTYVNATLEASLSADATEHPVGSASVKELYGDDDVLDGWAAMVKVAAGTGEESWYWYETTNLDQNSPIAEGIGNGVCTGCHSSGVDYVRTASSAF